MSPLELRRRWVYRRATKRRPGRSCARAWAARRFWNGQPKPLSSSGCAPKRRRLAARAVPRIDSLGHRHGSRLARRRLLTGSGEVKLASVASVELTGDARIRVLTASTEMGQGTKTIFPQIVAERLGVAYEDVEIAPQDTSIVPDSGPTVASRTAMVVGGL
jgi:CO/xanthine dehydrogenase Mo-binding subunit